MKVQKYEPKRFSYSDDERPRLGLLPNFNHEGACSKVLSHQTDSTRCVKDFSKSIEPRPKLIGVRAVLRLFSDRVPFFFEPPGMFTKTISTFRGSVIGRSQAIHIVAS